MLFGAHVSIAKRIQDAPQRADELGCECFQIFTRPPQGGKAKPLTPQVVEEFKKECKKYKFKDYYIHTPYFINLASSNNRIKYGSISAIRQDLERGSALGATYVMTHLGSAKDLGRAKAITQVVEAITMILKDYKGSTGFLIEMSAGAGDILGSKFEELAEITERAEKTLLSSRARPFDYAQDRLRRVEGSSKIGICFDTAHAFASGYNLSNKQAVDKVLKEFDRLLGLSKLKLIHSNDSAVDLGARRDRHDNIGYGKINIEGFRAIVTHPKLKKVNFILETPTNEGIKRDLKVLKGLRR